MYHDLSAYYRTIIPITQPLALERYYSDESQLDILHFLMSLLESPIDTPDLLAILKLCIHLVHHGSTTPIRHDAFLCVLQTLQVGLQPTKAASHDILFSHCFSLLASGVLAPDDTTLCAHSFADFIPSPNPLVKQKLLLFYCDERANPHFNLQQTQHITPAIIRFVFQSLTNYLYLPPQLPLESLTPTSPTPTIEHLDAWFYTHMIYGEKGINQSAHAHLLPLVIECLTERLGLDNAIAQAARTALTHLAPLYKPSRSCT